MAALGFALLVVKVMRVSHLNSRSGHALISNVGPIEILLGTFVTHFPMILFVIALLVTWWGVGSFAVLKTPSVGHAAAATVVVLALLLLPWPFVVILAGAAAFRFFHQRSRTAPRTSQRPYYVAAAALALLLIADAEPWMPAETFSLRDGSEFVGFAMAEAETSSGWTVILREEDRLVTHVREEEIAGRAPCHLAGQESELENFPSLLQITVDEATELPEPQCH